MLATLPPAEASPARVQAPTAGAEVVVGSLVEVSWNALPKEAKEMELYLSVDGGRHYSLRLTPQLPPGLAGLLWRVPNLPTPAARLRLRVGIPGRGEVDGEPSPVFRIVAAGPVSAEPVVLRGGELWVGRGSNSSPLTPPSVGDVGEEVLALLVLPLPAEAPRFPRPGPSTSASPTPPPALPPLHAHQAQHPPAKPGETTPLPLRR